MISAFCQLNTEEHEHFVGIFQLRETAQITKSSDIDGTKDFIFWRKKTEIYLNKLIKQLFTQIGILVIVT